MDNKSAPQTLVTTPSNDLIFSTTTVVPFELVEVTGAGKFRQCPTRDALALDSAFLNSGIASKNPACQSTNLAKPVQISNAAMFPGGCSMDHCERKMIRFRINRMKFNLG